MICPCSFILFALALLSLDPLERQEYAVALKLAPDLLSKETRILDFLRTENFSPVYAAKRLTLYWKYRRELFEDRWLLPMNLTGTGALSAEDVALLQTGYQVVFQRDPEDGLLFLLDETRVADRLDERSSTRLAFYYCTIFTDEVTQLRGATLVQLVKTAAATRPAVSAFPEGHHMIRMALPVRFRQILVTRAHHQQDRDNDVVPLIRLMEQMVIVAQFNFLQLPSTIMADSPQETLKLLETRGCRKALLPPCIGGDFDYAQLAEWFATRLTLESVTNGDNTTVSTADKLPAVPQAGPQHPRQQQEAEPKPLRRQEGGQHEQQQLLQFQEEGPNYPTTQRKRQSPLALSTTTTKVAGKPKLEETLASKTGETLSEEEIRKRNALYSRRTYHKRKMKLSLLEERVKVLEPKNKQLREENLRLEGLINDAQRLLRVFGAPS